jgi:hypothetical protein
MSNSNAEKNKAIVLEAFDTLFNKRDYATAQRFWSPNYIQHSDHIEPGRDGLFNLIKAAPPSLKYEPGVILAEDDYVIVHGRLWFEELFVVAFEVLCAVGCRRASAGGHVRCGTQASPGAIQAT